LAAWLVERGGGRLIVIGALLFVASKIPVIVGYDNHVT
jgi:hypothetical protein